MGLQDLHHRNSTKRSPRPIFATPRNWRGCAASSTSSWPPCRAVVSRLANKLQRLLMAQQNRHWEFDLEEGMLDTSRLPRIIIDPDASAVLQAGEGHQFPRYRASRCCWTIPAPCADVPSWWRRCAPTYWAARWSAWAVKTEILGFTTRAWKGGQSREKWTGRRQAAQSRPPQRSAPYRLQVRRRALAPRQEQSGPDDARGPAEGEYRRRGPDVGA